MADDEKLRGKRLLASWCGMALLAWLCAYLIGLGLWRLGEWIVKVAGLL